MGSLDGDCAVVYDGQFWEYAVFVGEGKVGETRAVAEVLRLGCIRDFARLNTEISKTLYISMLAADIICSCGLYVQCGTSCSYPLFTPNKYEIEPCALSSERSRSITLLKIPSSTTSHRNSSSSSLSFHFLGSKCQNSCNASNLCFFCH